MRAAAFPVHVVAAARARAGCMIVLRWSVCVSLVMPLLPRVIAAQVQAANDISDSPRLWRWSPLQPIADLGIPGPRLPAVPRLLDWPVLRASVPSIGVNPAALPGAIDSTWAQLVVSSGSVSGSYRRPLDPDAVSARTISLSGWRRIGTRTAAIGRVAVERDGLGSGSTSAFVAPYGSSPFVPADTNRPPLDRTIVTLEGAEGTSLGNWHVGVAVGHRAQESSSSRSTAAQVGRASSTGVTLGVDHALGSRVRVGAYGRGLQSSESVNLAANPQTVRVYVLNGFVTVPPSDFNVALPSFRRREDRSSKAVGANVAGTALGASWQAHVERQSLTARQFSSVLNANPPTDRWHTHGYAIGGAAQRTIRGLQATMSADWQAQQGDADRADTTALRYQADASRMSFTTKLRTVPSASRWSFAALLSVGRDAWTANDAAARISADIAAWSPGGSAELARRMNDRWSVAVAYGRAQYTPFASVPSPARRGAAYTLLLAPAIGVAAATAHTDQAGITARRSTPSGTMAFRLWTSSTSAAHAADVNIPLPPGSRTTWGVSMSLGPAQ